MKKQVVALCTGAVLALQFCLPVSAASLSKVQKDPLQSAHPAVIKAVVYPEDKEGMVSFQNLESRLKEDNLTIRSLQGNLDSQNMFDRAGAYRQLVDQINAMADVSWNMSMSGMNTASLQSGVESMYDQLENLKEENYDKVLKQVTNTVQNGIEQVIVGAESLYINIITYEASLVDLNRGLEALDRSIKELEFRLSLGQVSELTVQQLKTQRQTTKSQAESMQLGLEKMKSSLATLLGDAAGSKLELAALPAVAVNDPILKLSYDQALKKAKLVSFAVYSADKALEDAKDTWEDIEKKNIEGTSTYSMGKKNYDSAVLTRDAALENFDLSFKGLYQAIPDTKQALETAKTTLAFQEKTYAAEERKHELGQISASELQTKKDEVKTAQAAVAAAELKVFTACHQYKRAVEFGIVG